MNTPDVTDLLAWVDGELDPDRADAVARAVRGNPALAGTVASLRASRALPREAYDAHPVAPVPERLERSVRALLGDDAAPSATRPPRERRAAADRRVSRRGRRAEDREGVGAVPEPTTSPGRRLAKVASFAGVALGAALLGGAIGRQIGHGGETRDGWTERVAEYQSLYVRATVENAVRDPDRERALLERLAAEHALEPRVPDLSAEGYRFVRVQELGWRGEPLVQLVYLADEGMPLALCYLPDAREPRDLELGRHAGLASATWRDGEQRYVVVGDVDVATLEAVHRRSMSTWGEA